MGREHPHTEVALCMWAAIAEGDAAALADVLAPGVVWRSAGDNRVSGDFFGRQAVMDYLASVGEFADELISTPDTVYVSDEGAVVAYHISASRGERTLEMDYLIRLRIEDSLVISAISIPLDQRSNDAFWS